MLVCSPEAPYDPNVKLLLGQEAIEKLEKVSTPRRQTFVVTAVG